MKKKDEDLNIKYDHFKNEVLRYINSTTNQIINSNNNCWLYKQAKTLSIIFNLAIGNKYIGFDLIIFYVKKIWAFWCMGYGSIMV